MLVGGRQVVADGRHFDHDAIAAEFAATHAALVRGEGFAWRTTPEGRLAEIVVLDQFSRQLFRSRPEAFASDPMALLLAQECVGGGFTWGAVLLDF